jgi:epsilon-lactone hydrolase
MSSTELARVMAQLRAHPFQNSAREQDLRRGLDGLAKLFKPVDGVKISTTTLGGLPAEFHSVDERGPVVVFLHGGGYVIGSSLSHRHVASLLARETAGQVYALDYRLAPQAPFPAAVEDALAAVHDLTARHPGAGIALVGDSAGGGLAFTTALSAMSQGLTSIKAVVALSPWVNLGSESESYDKLAALDPLLSRDVTDYFSSRYLAGTPPSHPMASPLFADLRGLPPVLIQIGDRECFFGDAVRFHQALIAAGVDSELSVWKEMFHVWHLYWPVLTEGRTALELASAFIIRHLQRPPSIGKDEAL